MLYSNHLTLSFISFLSALSILVTQLQAFDDDFSDHQKTQLQDEGPLPKDKILLKDVKTLSFYRHKMTTAKRTHSIHQLSCVGGTAGCKMFTPDVVECRNIGYNNNKSKFDWQCHADTSDRVKFNHVEVICEGYEYPEDDYILLGSCGLEFTLDYSNPNDYHEKSYFNHLDEHEKDLHERNQPEKAKSSNQMYIVFVIIIPLSILLVKYLLGMLKHQSVKVE